MEKTQKSITFVVTEDCNFDCSYCYLIHKNPNRRMPLSVAKKAIDYLLENRTLFNEEVAIWDFIGGEPLLEVDLIEQIIEYIRLRSYELSHPWFSSSHFSMSSNGALYHTEQVQRLIRLYKNELDIGLTIDGPQHVHDLARVFPDGRGTYAQVVANIPLWIEQFPTAATKVTIAHENLPHLAESVLHCFELGIKNVHANVVFEDVWKPGDSELLEAQLDSLADEMIARELWRDHDCSFFNDFIGNCIDPREDGNWCGAGMMLAIDAEGNFYPCNRFLDFSLVKRPARRIGNVDTGIDLNRLRPFLSLTRSAQSPEKCLACEVASGCAWCQGLNYDDADTATIYQRAVHICQMHKARARANARYQGRVAALRAAETDSASVTIGAGA